MSGYIGNIPVPQATQSFETFTATGGQTSFGTAGYTPGYLQVYLNGVLLDNGSDYTASNGSDVVLTVGAISGDILTVISFSTFEVSNQAFTGDFSVDSPTFVVDSTNDRVGIGSSSPVSKLEVKGASPVLTINQTDTSTTCRLSFYGYNRGYETTAINTTEGGSAGAGNLVFWTNPGGSGNTVERMRITSDGDVVIRNNVNNAKLEFQDPSNSTGMMVQQVGSSGAPQLRFFDTAAGTERARIDSSGSLMVGKTSLGVANLGFAARYFGSGSDGGTTIELAKDNATAMYINRTTSDGTIIDFRKDNSAVGSIATEGGDLTIGNDDTKIKFIDASDTINPTGASNSGRDAAINLGSSFHRFKDLYLSGGVYIGGTGAANKLEDYEEGTFTLTLGGTGGDPTVSSYTYNTGYYRKIGDVVCINCFFEIPSGNATGGSGDALLKGLPFSLFTGQLHLSYVEYTGSYSSGRNALTIRCVSGENRIRVRQMNYTDMGLNINTALGLSQFISGLIKIEVSGFFIV